MNRVLFEENEIAAGGIVRLSGVRAKHVLEVLHGSVGQKVRVGVINGVTGEAVIEDIWKSEVILKCVFEGKVPPAPAVDLLLALPRPKVMKRLWAQLAALGVGHIVVTNAAKVERNYYDTQWLERKHYEPMLVEGLMQSADTRLPKVTICRRLKVFVEDEIEDLFPCSSRYVFNPGAEPAIKVIKSVKGRRVLIAVGPEGGWTDFEVDLLNSHGFVCVGMGSRILRSDTACVAALALTHAAIGL